MSDMTTNGGGDMGPEAKLLAEASRFGGTVRISRDGDRIRGEVRWPGGDRFWCRWTTTRGVLADLQREVDRVARAEGNPE